MSRRSCEACKFFAIFDYEGAKAPIVPRGECRKSAPKSTEHAKSVFPIIEIDGWCGEFKSKLREGEMITR